LKRKLIALDLALLAGIVAEIWQFRRDWVNAQLREQAVLHQHVAAPALPALISSPRAEPVSATSYAEIALKMLFSKDRNPEVVVAAPPPPKPMPPLPLLYGIMNVGDGPTVIMSEKSGAKHQGIRTGDKIGPFTLVAANNQEITLGWEGKTVTKAVDEMIDRGPSPPPQEQGPIRSAPSRPAQTSNPVEKVEAAPGKDVGNNFRACQPGDTSPPGTASGGFRKVVTPSPFGDMCRWVPI
jgi:hypothetical protein